MHKSNNLSESVIFSTGEKITDDYFIGTAWLERLVSNDSTFNCPISNVTFEPGARNNWHQHPGGADFACYWRQRVLSGKRQASTGDSGRRRSKDPSKCETLAWCYTG